MLILIALIISIILQFFAAFYALKFIKETNWKLSWILIATAFLLMALRRSFEIIPYLTDFDNSGLENFNHLTGVIISILIATGVVLISKIFLALKKAETERIESAKKFKTLFHSSSDEIYLTDKSGRFLEVNDVFCEIMGYSNQELLSLNLKDIYSDNNFSIAESIIEKLKQGSVIFESEHKTKTGKNIPVEIKSRLIDYDGIEAILCIARDITERKQTERKILNAVIETEDRERERFAKDLHDELGNILSSINIYVQLLKSDEIDEAERKNLMNYFKGLVDEAIATTKEMAINLHPNTISRSGLPASINSFCKKINETGLIKIHFNTNIDEDRLAKDIEINLYKIITELISNTLKHASADNIYIALTEENNLLYLKYQDNGIGFDYEKVLKDKNNKGMGLSNITSRVNALDGQLKIDSSKDKGTVVIIKTNIN